LRRQLQAELEHRTESRLSQPEAVTTTEELTKAVPPTETLNVEAQRGRAELARQGSLAERNVPHSVAARRSGGGPRSPPDENGATSADASFDRKSEEGDSDEVRFARMLSDSEWHYLHDFA